MVKFKDGDRVIYISGKHGEKETNPLWDGKFGKIVGTVDSRYRGNLAVGVKWDNRTTNTYNENDLKSYEKRSIMKAIKDAATSVYGFVKPYEKYIGIVALALVIDHFVLGNKFSSRFRALAEGLVTKAVDALDVVLEKLGMPAIEDKTETSGPADQAETSGPAAQAETSDPAAEAADGGK